MDTHKLSRLHFNALCAAVGSALPAAGATIEVLSVASAIAGEPRRTMLRNGAIIPALGQGSARLGQGRHPEATEEEALRTGISLGMLIPLETTAMGVPSN
jgi:hypothetical protein